ncbi:uncharacterized protein TNCV_803541 [Trichonephila clavipes]|nr:uncharacterized protein TNCV_803541 [Trichonephila clavipes]
MPITILASNETNLLAAGHHNGTITIFDVIQENILQKLKAHSQEILSLSWNPTSPEMLLTASFDLSLRLWKIGEDKPVNSYYVPVGRVRYEDKKKLSVWNVCEKKLELQVPILTGFIYGLSFSSINPNLLAMGNGDGTVKIWNAQAESAEKNVMGIYVHFKELHTAVTVDISRLFSKKFFGWTSSNEIGTRLSCKEEESISNSLHSEEVSMEILKEKPLTLEKKLEKAIYSETKVLYCSTEKSTSFNKIMKQEMQLFDLTENQSPNIIKLYEALRTIPPMSVEAERAFSAAGLFVTKLRTRLSDKMFNDESHFQLCPDDHRRPVCRRPGKRSDLAFKISGHTGRQPGVMIWRAISFDSRTPLVVIRSNLKHSGASMAF